MSKDEIEESMKKAAEEKPKEDKQEEKEKQPKEKTPEDQISELKSTLQHLQADFENYKKRTERDMESFRTFANEELIKELLPTLDHFELALKNTDSKDEFVKGIELIYSELQNCLTKSKVTYIETKDQPFDPHFHEAHMAEVSDKPEGTILEEFQKGYRIGDKVLRTSKVKVAKKKTE